MALFKPEDLSALGLATRLAFTLALPPVAGLLLGQHLGRLYGHEALFILIGVCVGLAAGCRGALRLLLKK